MENDSSFNNTLKLFFSSKYKPEVPYMITQGRLEHIEAIAEEIEKYEQWEPRWDWQKIILSACASTGLTGVGLLLNESQLQFRFLISTVTVGAIIGSIVCMLGIWGHHKEKKEKYKFQSNKLKTLIAKIKESIEQ